MSLIKDLESKLERLVEGAFAKGFKSSVQPVEIAKKIDREMESGRTLSVSKIFIPNEYTVRLSPADKAAFDDFEDSLKTELIGFADKRRKAKNYSVVGNIRIILEADAKLQPGLVEVEARLVTPRNSDDSTAAASVTLMIDDEEEETFFLGDNRVTIGRLEENEIPIPDPGLSRHHADISREIGNYILTDLGSTNGTFVNGKRVAEKTLKDGDKIGIGKVILVFRRL
jgi:hypothetical protein